MLTTEEGHINLPYVGVRGSLALSKQTAYLDFGLLFQVWDKKFVLLVLQSCSVEFCSCFKVPESSLKPGTSKYWTKVNLRAHRSQRFDSIV
jgi:hypothetical protein